MHRWSDYHAWKERRMQSDDRSEELNPVVSPHTVTATEEVHYFPAGRRRLHGWTWFDLHSSDIKNTSTGKRKMSSSAAQCASNKPVIYILELPAANSCYRSKQGPRVGLEALISAFIAAIDSSVQYHFCFVFLRKLLMTQFRFGNKMINSERWSRSVRWVDAEGWNHLLSLLWRNLVRRPHLCS